MHIIVFKTVCIQIVMVSCLFLNIIPILCAFVELSVYVGIYYLC